MKTKKINTGIYRIFKDTFIFEVDKSDDGQWKLSQIINGNFRYIDHYKTLSTCKIIINNGAW